MNLAKVNKVLLFLIITFVVDWGMIETFYALGGKNVSIAGTIVTVIYMFVPMLTAFFIEGVIHKQKIGKALFIRLKPNWWWLVAWLTMPLFAFAALGVSLLFNDVSFSWGMEGMFERFETYMTPEQLSEMHRTMDEFPIHPIWITVFQGLIAGISINAIAGLGEETGWRAFLLKEWSHMKFWPHSLLVGAIWGLWHAPLILRGHNYPEHPTIGAGMMIIWCMLLAPLFTFVTLKGKSVITAAVFHGTLNACAGIAIMLIVGGNDLTVGVSGVAGFVVLIGLNIIMLVYDRFISRKSITTAPISVELNTFYNGQQEDQGNQTTD